MDYLIPNPFVSSSEEDEEEYDTFDMQPSCKFGAPSFQRALPSKSSHTVFILDLSGSMRTVDVRRGDRWISRSDAVFDCCYDFIQDQISSTGAKSNDTCTIITFNDEATQWTGYPNPPKMKHALLAKVDDIQSRCYPQLKTNYLAGLDAALRMCSQQRFDVTTIVFLSDGRPGDLNFNSRNEGELMELMDDFQHLPGQLKFHTIGFGPDTFVWLRKMAAACVDGRFHSQQDFGGCLSFYKLQSTFRTISTELSTVRSSMFSSEAPKRSAMSRISAASINYARLRDADMDLQPCTVLFFKLNGNQWTFPVALRSLFTRISSKPFAQGGSRNAWRMSLIKPGDQQQRAWQRQYAEIVHDLQGTAIGGQGEQQLVGKEWRQPGETALKFHAANF
ncbi:hypothetical protein DUNSADRAFT_12365 [Dunaliella salina]|uniref:VWFA domain-containing protein n=1 Tax=Dunaliella salina TaxID=3046 RepID=A0ABQ7GBE4_DUNSA|nr:hypothetical protein DUNSADRAFT_12365 [Dunaliella salina]|eukprot:KAF5831932.1 hypothetical protein DUNSADRAFT_12365 [Dunaliella salina]